MVNLSKITLQKGSGISLAKRAGGFGSLRIGLSWSAGKKPGLLAGMFGGGAKSIDLDLGCFVRTRDGQGHVIQALGKAFGSFDRTPFVQLPGDDRSGGGGEELRVNGDRWDEIRQILVYATIYEGVQNWSQADGFASVRAEGHPEIEVRLDQARDGMGACAIALLENDGGSIRLTKLAEYFRSQQQIDEHFGWGFNWTTGRK